MLKRCPFLRTVLHRIISTCWATQNVPKSWKKGFTILIHKKGECSDPSNFRPKTLQPVCAKVYSTLIRNRMYNFSSLISSLNRTSRKVFGREYLVQLNILNC